MIKGQKGASILYLAWVSHMKATFESAVQYSGSGYCAISIFFISVPSKKKLHLYISMQIDSSNSVWFRFQYRQTFRGVHQRDFCIMLDRFWSIKRENSLQGRKAGSHFAKST